MMKAALLGYGTVGGGVDRIIQERGDIRITRILEKYPKPEIADRVARDMDEIVADPEIDIVIELLGGVHPAFEFVKAALEAGKHVVTANKALVSAYCKELTALAEEHGVAFRCTPAVGGGIPWLHNLARCRRVDEIREVRGIMNGTTNFILHTMLSGTAFEDALKTAQELGFAEADPTADIDGWDIRRKLVISAAVAFDLLAKEEEIPMFGIRTITAQDIANFRTLGRTCKLMAYGTKSKNGVSAYVEPTLLLPNEPEASVPANYNTISLDGKLNGIQSFYGQGAGRFPTAANVVSDCLDILAGERDFYAKPVPASVDNSDAKHAYYVRTAHRDAFLTGNCVTEGNGFVITKDISVDEMHRWAKEKAASDPALFFAAIR
ncbi:MAG: homoserine dehydrogenase [Oscillospiraceae bacterium]|nr:homoserine dehydrogenase [Oscillospiraceae bacterium]